MKSHIVRLRPRYTTTVFLLAVFLLGGAVALTRSVQSEPAAAAPSSSSPDPAGTQESAPAEKAEEMRGVWVPYMALSVQGEDAFRERVDAIVSTCLSLIHI